jgi:hypothetical protein
MRFGTEWTRTRKACVNRYAMPCQGERPAPAPGRLIFSPWTEEQIDSFTSQFPCRALPSGLSITGTWPSLVGHVYIDPCFSLSLTHRAAVMAAASHIDSSRCSSYCSVSKFQTRVATDCLWRSAAVSPLTGKRTDHPPWPACVSGRSSDTGWPSDRFQSLIEPRPLASANQERR